MNLSELVSNHLYNKGTAVLADGISADDVKKAFSGLDEVLKGLSESEMNKMTSDTPALESYYDKRAAEVIRKRETDFKTDLEKERANFATKEESYKSSITQLKSSVPMSADPAELRKQALDEPDPSKREMLIMKADNIEIKQQLAERTAIEEKQLADLTREKLVNVARTELGDRKLPKSIAENLHMFIGPDEETTKGKITNFAAEWDDYNRDIKTASLNPEKPPGTGEEEKDPVATMNEKMSALGF